MAKGSSGMSGTAGCAGGGPDVRTGSYDGDGDNDTEYAGTGSAAPNALNPPAGTSTANQPRPEDFMD